VFFQVKKNKETLHKDQNIGEIKTKIREIHTMKNKFFVWISLCIRFLVGFPGFLKESGKSGKIQTKKQSLLFIVWISSM
jgi:hypothetical protein